MKAWYFAQEDRKLRYGDNRFIILGESHSVDAEPILCSSGLHASVNIRDALAYAPGPILYLVELSGKMDIGDDKVSAQVRNYLAGFDATDMLQEFARKQALINIEKIKPYTDQYDLIVEYLQTGREDLRSAAWSAARSAVESAAESAAWSAAESAVESAAESAAWAAVRSAVRSAAWSAESAARSAVESAVESAESAQSEMLIDLVYKYYPSIEEVM